MNLFIKPAICLQNTTVLGEVDHVKKNISRCLVKSEQLVDDVTNIAKQNDMIRNDMRDLKLLCDYLSSKNDETQRYKTFWIHVHQT